MFEHKSGLPHALNRASGKPEQKSVVFYGERSFIQAAELNEMQEIERARLARVGRMVASDGDRIERGNAAVDTLAGTVTLTAGKVFASGDVHDVPAAVLTGVPMTGRVEIGIRLVTAWLTHEDDPTLVGLIPGSLAEGEPGAAREIVTASWSRAGDGRPGDFFASYVLQNGTILDQEGPSVLAPALEANKIYDQANGNYVVRGCRVTALGANAGEQVFSIEQGEANINGMKRTRFAALRISEAEDWDEQAIPGETHSYAGGANFTFTVALAPIGVISSILVTKEKTVTITRGAIANGADGLPDTSVISVSLVKQGATTYSSPSDYNRINNTIDWAPAGAEPAAGSSYQVTYRYRASVTADSFTNSQVTVSGGVAGGDVIIAYTRKLPRIDRIGLQEDGSPIYVHGISGADPVAPRMPDNVLNLAKVRNDWMSTPVVTNDASYSWTWDALNRVLEQIPEMQRLFQLERIRNGIDAREPVLKKGVFVDPFTDDSYRDAGIVQSGAIGNGMLMLAITPTFYQASLTAPVMLDYTEEVIVAQELKTACEKINPYANFTQLPGTVKLTPAADFWTESREEWLSAETLEFNRGTRIDGGPLTVSSTSTEAVGQRSEQLEFLRQISITFTISGFFAGENLAILTFDGISVKPPGTQTANGTGQITGSFTIPENVTAGTKVVEATGAGGSSATALFVGEGTIEVDTMRRVTTIERWSAQRLVSRPRSEGGRGANDPQAQLFAVPETRQLVGVDFHLCAIGNTAKNIVVDQVGSENGYPTIDVAAEAFVPMAGAATGWKSARYHLPVTTGDDRRHAFVIKTDDNLHSVSIAKLGGFDAELQKPASAHPYVTGPRFSSVNAETWSAHQDEALAFRLVAAKFTATEKTVALGSFALVNCSDLQVRAAFELPSAGCSITFEIERTNGTIYRLAPGQVLQLTEFITETVTLRAILKGTSKLSPILYAPVELVAGSIATSLTYVTRAFPLGTAVRIAAYLKAYLPGGASLTMEISKDGGAFVTLPLATTEALAFPLWTERKYELTGQTATLVRLRITGAGGPAARLVIGDFGAGII